MPLEESSFPEGGSSVAEIVYAVRSMYERHPFSPMQRKNSYRHHAAYVRQFLRERGIQPNNMKFGDIACGIGLMMLDYAREFPEATFVGYDISEPSVKLVDTMLEQEGITNARAHVLDITKLEAKDEFDYIVSWGTLPHLPYPPQGIAALCRALRSGGILLRIGVYGFYGNQERRIQRETIRTILEGTSRNDALRIEAVGVWARGDPNFKNQYTAPFIDLEDDNWVVDEFLHVWEQHLRLKDVVSWLRGEGMHILRMTDYYNEEIPLHIAQYPRNPAFIAMVEKLAYESQCHIIDMIARSYWLSVFAEKAYE